MQKGWKTELGFPKNLYCSCFLLADNVPCVFLDRCARIRNVASDPRYFGVKILNAEVSRLKVVGEVCGVSLAPGL